MESIKNLIIFDFSGTLSIGSIFFGKKEILINALKKSGLWQDHLLNITFQRMILEGQREEAVCLIPRRPITHQKHFLEDYSIQMFWNDVIAPTWHQGATSSIGYKTLLAQRLALLCNIKKEQLLKPASCFVDLYFANSQIEITWIPVLKKLLSWKDTLLIIATEHYAEATNHIICQLQVKGNIIGAGVLEQKQFNSTKEILIANSADLKALKSSDIFWEKVKKSLNLNNISKVVIIDDFGFNETFQDIYSAKEKVHSRQINTKNVLSQVFNTNVNLFPFLIKDIEKIKNNNSEFIKLIKQVENFIKEKII